MQFCLAYLQIAVTMMDEKLDQNLEALHLNRNWAEIVIIATFHTCQHVILHKAVAHI